MLKKISPLNIFYIKRPYYKTIGFNKIIVNWIFQRIFRINGDVPFSVSYTSLVQGYNNIIFSDKSHTIKTSFAVSGGCYFGISDGSTLEIGNGTIWAFNVCIQTSNHDFIDREKNHLKSVKIGENCWIGNSVTILPGVQLGDNVTIGANSVVTKSFSSNVVIAGCPAKIIKELPVSTESFK